MSQICPTVTPSTPDPHLYREQIERISWAPRIQIDLMDGVFAPNKNTNPVQIWWPEAINADIHLMYQKPSEHLETLVSLSPHLIILHAEAEGDIVQMMQHIQKFGLMAGVALLADTAVASAQPAIEAADHILLFAGRLGYFGGEADLDVLEKVAQIRALNPRIEIGWDGGANLSNVRQLAAGGVDVINCGSSIQRSPDPRAAYDELSKAVDDIAPDASGAA